MVKNNLLKAMAAKLLLLVNLLAAALFLLACLAPYVPPDRFWPLSFLGLAFPYLFIVVFGFLVFWLFFRIPYCLLSAAVLIAGWKSLAVMFAFHTGGGTEDPNAMTVMSYNVRYFKDFNYSPPQNRALRTKIMKLIEDCHPDILCLQEFFTSESPREDDNRTFISERMGLPYRYFSSDHNFENNHSGVILFSRYPIVHAAKIALGESRSGESAVYADIVKNGADTFRLFTLHLQSVYLTRKDLAGIQKVKTQEDTGLVASRIIVSKLKKAFLQRERQARKVAAAVRRSPYPVILCGDFNDTPNSYSYFTIRGKLQDAFLEKGFGFGRTYSGIAPTLRIDYIFASPSIGILSFRRIKKVLSDHYPIIARLRTTGGHEESRERRR
jgi:endonuclease/exonuclease/phosphatase family metal-dependent hydrolase